MKRASALATMVSVVTLGGCASIGPACGTGEQAAIHDTLYLGTGRPGGGVVTAEEWTQFLATVVTPRFPQGLTVFEVSGQWQGADGAIVRETTHVLQLVHADRDAEPVAAIAQAYKRRFQQEAVLRVSSPVCMSLSP